MSCFCSCKAMSGFNADMVLPDKADYQDPNWVLVENSP
jgi:hypothetical protein